MNDKKIRKLVLAALLAALVCVATMVATAFMKETRGHDLHRVGHN